MQDKNLYDNEFGCFLTCDWSVVVVRRVDRSPDQQTVVVVSSSRVVSDDQMSSLSSGQRVDHVTERCWMPTSVCLNAGQRHLTNTKPMMTALTCRDSKGLPTCKTKTRMQQNRAGLGTAWLSINSGLAAPGSDVRTAYVSLKSLR